MQHFAFLIPIVMVTVFGVIALSVFLYKRQWETERTRQLQRTAAQRMLYGEASGIKAVVFDFVYVLGSGKNSRTCAQTMVYLEPGNISLPYFSLRSERFAHKIWAAFGYQDIDFGNRPTFNSQYLLRGPDEQAIRKMFNDSLLSFYEMNPGTCTDGGGNRLFVYRENYRCEPQQIQPFIGLALSVLNLLPHYR